MEQHYKGVTLGTKQEPTDYHEGLSMTLRPQTYSPDKQGPCTWAVGVHH